MVRLLALTPLLVAVPTTWTNAICASAGAADRSNATAPTAIDPTTLRTTGNDLIHTTSGLGAG
jgi:hypothetical protein